MATTTYATGNTAAGTHNSLQDTLALVGRLLLVGWQARWAALGLAVFVAVITPIFHGYWALPEAQQMMQKQAFNKNLGILGGLLAYAAFGPGRFSLDAKKRV